MTYTHLESNNVQQFDVCLVFLFILFVYFAFAAMNNFKIACFSEKIFKYTTTASDRLSKTLSIGSGS